MIPHTLKIRGHVYKVEQLNKKELGAAIPECSAYVDNDLNVIRLYKGAAPSRKVELILHEVFHAMLSGYQMEADVEESVVVTLGEGLTEFIKANPSFIRHAIKVLCSDS